VEILEAFFAQGADGFVQGQALIQEQAESILVELQLQAVIFAEAHAEGGYFIAQRLPVQIHVPVQKRAQRLAGRLDHVGRDFEGLYRGRGQLELGVAQGVFEHCHDAAGAGLLLVRKPGDLADGFPGGAELDPVALEIAPVLLEHVVLGREKNTLKVLG